MKAPMTVNGSDYTGTYDEAAHTIDVNVTTPTSGATIYYSTTELTNSNYTTGSKEKIMRTEAGTTTVYWYAHSNDENYEDQSGRNTITINKATGSVTVTITGENIVGQKLTAEVNTKSDGNLSYQWWYSELEGATSGTAIPNANSSTYTVEETYSGKYIGCTVTVAEGTNYTACTGSGITNSTTLEPVYQLQTSEGETSTFGTLAAAHEAADDGSTITLLKDTDDNSSVNIVKDITLAFGNYTMISENTIKISDNSKVAFNSGTIKGNVPNGNATIMVSSGSTLDVNGGTITREAQGVEALTIELHGTLNMNNGKITSPDSCTIYSEAGERTLNIKGGEISHDTGNYYTIYNGEGGIVNATGGTVTQSEGSSIKNVGTLNISENAVFKNISATTSADIYNEGTATISGGTITADNVSAIYNYSTLNISENAKIQGNANDTVQTLFNKGTVNMTGGTIGAKGYFAVDNRSQMNVNGSTCEIMSESAPAVYNAGNLEFEQGNIYHTSGNAFTVMNQPEGTLEMTGGSVTVTSGSGINNQGTFNMSGNASVSLNITSGSSCAIQNSQGATMNLTGGTVTSTDVGLYNMGNLNINNSPVITGTSASSQALMNKSTGTVTMNGGTITSTNAIGIGNEGVMVINGTTSNGCILKTSNNATIVNRNDLTISGKVDISHTSGSVYTIGNSGTMEMTGGTVSQGEGAGISNTGEVHLGGTAVVKNDYKGLVVSNNGTMTVTDNAKVTSTSSVAVDNYGSLTTSGSASITAENCSVIDNNTGATMYMEGTSNVINKANSTVNTGSVYYAFTNRAGATFEMRGDSYVTQNGQGISIDNLGTMRMYDSSRISADLTTGIYPVVNANGGYIYMYDNSLIENQTSVAYWCIENEEGANLIMNGGRIIGKEPQGVINQAGASFTMTGTALVQSNGSPAVYNMGAFTLGSASETLSTKNPQVLGLLNDGGGVGIYQIGTFYFYNGIVKAQYPINSNLGSSAMGTINGVRSGYSVVTGTETINGYRYNTAYLR